MSRQKSWLALICDYLRDPVEALGQVYTCFKIVRSPAMVPFSLATVQLVNNSMSSLYTLLTSFTSRLENLSELIDKVRRFYDLLDCGNQIQDGTIPFPENQADISLGISVEFKNVSFKYSDKDDLAIKNASFKIEQGQLCVSPVPVHERWELISDVRSSLGKTDLARARSFLCSRAYTT